MVLPKGIVISFDPVIWSVSTTIIVAFAPFPKRQPTFRVGQVLVPPNFLKLWKIFICPALPMTNVTVFLFDKVDDFFTLSLVWFHRVAEEGHVFIYFLGVPDCNKVVCPTVCEVHFYFLLSIFLGLIQLIACKISTLGLEGEQ
jgi:hypothetical protein